MKCRARQTYRFEFIYLARMMKSELLDPFARSGSHTNDNELLLLRWHNFHRCSIRKQIDRKRIDQTRCLTISISRTRRTFCQHEIINSAIVHLLYVECKMLRYPCLIVFRLITPAYRRLLFCIIRSTIVALEDDGKSLV